MTAGPLHVDHTPRSTHAPPHTAASPSLEAALDYIVRGIAILPSHYPVQPTPTDQPQRLACSCGNLSCALPARHSLGTLTIHDATVNAARVARWWLAFPEANLATPAGISFDVLALHHPGPAEQIVMWLAAQGIESGPIITAGLGHLRFPVRGSDPAAPSSDKAEHGGLRRLTPGTLVLLPPSRLIDDTATTWLQPFDNRTVLLPDCRRLFEALAQLPEPQQLDQWARARGTHYDRLPPMMW